MIVIQRCFLDTCKIKNLTDVLIEIEKSRSAKSATSCKCGTIPSVAMFECLSKAEWLNCGDMPDCKFIVEQGSEKNTNISLLETM